MSRDPGWSLGSGDELDRALEAAHWSIHLESLEHDLEGLTREELHRIITTAARILVQRRLDEEAKN